MSDQEGNVVKNLITKLSLIIRWALSYIPSTIYDTVISKMLTNYSYERLLTLIEKHPLPKDRPLRMLDIGVGTAVPLFNIWNKLPKNIDVMGVDIDHSYVLKAQRLFKDISNNQGSRHITLEEKNFYEMSVQKNGKFDLIVFSSSFMLMPYRAEALELAKSLLVENGKIIFILTLQPPQKKKTYFSSVIEFIKPKLKYLLTIDFGQITYEDAFDILLDEAKLDVTYRERLSKANNIPTKIFRVFLVETVAKRS